MSKTIQTATRIIEVPIGLLRVSAASQREFNANWGNQLADTFDINIVGQLIVSFRDGYYWLLDGQHRAYAMITWAKREFGDEWPEWEAFVNCHDNLNEQQEAALFLKYNQRRLLSAYDKFTVGVTAGLPVENDIDRIVRSLGLRVDKDRKPGSVSAIAALMAVYQMGDAVLLGKTLTVIRDAWAATGFDSEVLRGVGLFINRYEGRYNQDRLIKRLAALSNGSKGLRWRAQVIKDSHGSTLAVAHAAAVTDVYNQGARGTASLGSWWKDAS